MKARRGGMDDRPLVEARALSKTFGRARALTDVSFSLSKGEFLALVGGNGAGKTTLIKILGGIMRPSTGAAYFRGERLVAGNRRLRSRIGFVSHAVILYGELSSLQNLRFFGRLFSVDRLEEKIHETLQRFSLAPRMYEPVKTYSRGMLQRLSIARALLHDPELLLLDEPYTGLDVEAAETVTEILEALHSEGRTIIMATHQIDGRLEMADRVGILERGRLTMSAAAGEWDSEAIRRRLMSPIGEIAEA